MPAAALCLDLQRPHVVAGGYLPCTQRGRHAPPTHASERAALAAGRGRSRLWPQLATPVGGRRVITRRVAE
eukprot:COSAG01_NODE_11698_length_1877_cov_44.832958_1_plen_70_part_10